MLKITVFDLFVLCILLSLFYNYRVDSNPSESFLYSKTFLDGESVRSMYRTFRDLTLRLVGQTGRRTRGTFLQDTEGDFPCNKTGMRSSTIPNSVHRLKPGK